MSLSKLFGWSLTAVMMFGGLADQTAFAQRFGRGGWGGGGRSGFSAGYSPRFGVSLGYNNGGWGGYNRGYGGGYGGYGRGYGGYYGGGYGSGYGYGNGYYSQPYYSQQYYSQPVYAQPVYTQPVYAAPAAPVFDGGEIVLFSAADTPGDVQYTLNGVQYQLRPGSVQRFRNDRAWTIEVASGVGQAPQQFTLVTGRYKFKPSANGIALVTTQDLPGSSQPATTLAPAPMPNL